MHGDAKLANFCFANEGQQVAAVDFQYVGGGPGIKDVALLIGSALSSEECFRHEAYLLDAYFNALHEELDKPGRAVGDWKALETDWRELYCFAWADFTRFLTGWSPGHWKLHKYSETQTQYALDRLQA